MCINAVCLPNLPHSQCAWRLLSSRYMCRSATSSSYGSHILDISPSTCFSLACTEPLRQSLPFPAYLSSVLTMWPFQGCPPTLESEYTVTSLWTCWLLGRKMVGYYCLPRDLAPTTAYWAYNVFTVFMRCWIIRCIVKFYLQHFVVCIHCGVQWNLHVCGSVCVHDRVFVCEVPHCCFVCSLKNLTVLEARENALKSLPA